MANRVAFVWFGVMGYPMAGRLRRIGREAGVFDRITADLRGLAGTAPGAIVPPWRAGLGCRHA